MLGRGWDSEMEPVAIKMGWREVEIDTTGLVAMGVWRSQENVREGWEVREQGCKNEWGW